MKFSIVLIKWVLDTALDTALNFRIESRTNRVVRKGVISLVDGLFCHARRISGPCDLHEFSRHIQLGMWTVGRFG
jgi:hypothetical protein